MKDNQRVQAMEGCIRDTVRAYTESFLAARREHGDGPHALQDILTDTMGFIGLWILFLTIACPVVIMEVNLPTTELTHTAQENLVRLSSSALREYTRRAQQLANNKDVQRGDSYDPNEFTESLIALVRAQCR